jgi:hypothetical protein
MMRTQIVRQLQEERVRADQAWLDLEHLAQVELSSEDSAHPIANAFLRERSGGWLAAEPGKQIIRLLFGPSLDVHRIRLEFRESSMERTQEYALRWSPDGGRSWHEVVRQQWNFSPAGATCETEDHRVELLGLIVLELIITPDISGRNALASLAQLQMA